MKRLALCLLTLLPFISNSQDLAFARKMVDTLSSPTFWGRGYTNDGLKKAGSFIASQFEAYGLKPMDGKSYLQPFTHSVNTFPG